MADLRIELAGISLEHPLLLASGPLSWNGEAIVRAHRAGAAAIVTKTISRSAARSPRPHIASLPGGFLNAERWSDLDPAVWTERELPLAKDAGATVIASVGLTRDDVATLAHSLEQAGADALEVVSYDESDLADMVREAVSTVRVPVFAKVHANGRSFVETARACVSQGAAAITAIDSLGPALRVDLEGRRPLLAADAAWWSGSAILPIALYAVCALRRAVPVPIVGTGGVGSAEAAAEMLFAGATAVGVCSAPLAGGLGIFEVERKALSKRLDDLGIPSARSAVGAMGDEIETGSAFSFEARLCSGCRACVRCCPYEARQSPQSVGATCRGCGLCVSLCPTKALRWERRAA